MLGLIICALGVLDVLLTRHGLAHGLIGEVNPLLAAMFAWHPAIATAAAILVPSLAVLLIYTFDRRRLSPWAGQCLWGLLAVRLAVTAMHLTWLTQVALARAL